MASDRLIVWYNVTMLKIYCFYSTSDSWYNVITHTQMSLITVKSKIVKCKIYLNGIEAGREAGSASGFVPLKIVKLEVFFCCTNIHEYTNIPACYFVTCTCILLKRTHAFVFSSMSKIYCTCVNNCEQLIWWSNVYRISQRHGLACTRNIGAVRNSGAWLSLLWIVNCYPPPTAVAHFTNIV